MALVDEALRAWLELPMPGMITVVNARREPVSLRTWAVRASAREDVLEVYVLADVEPAFFEALAESGRAAADVIELPSYRSRMFKGVCVVTDEDPDEAFLRARLPGLAAALGSVGMPLDSVDRMFAQASPARTMRVLSLRVDAVFDQSPKPGAGERL